MYTLIEMDDSPWPMTLVMFGALMLTVVAIGMFALSSLRDTSADTLRILGVPVRPPRPPKPKRRLGPRFELALLVAVAFGHGYLLGAALHAELQDAGSPGESRAVVERRSEEPGQAPQM